MLISHEHRFIYIKTRKTAGTSLEIGVSPHLGEDDVVTGLNAEEEAVRASLGGRSAQHTHVPMATWRNRDWIKAAMGRRPRYSQHTPAFVARRYLPPEQWAGYFGFAVDRNPWDLSVSAHRWYQKRTGQELSFREFVFSAALPRYSNWDMYTIDDVPVLDRIYRFGELDVLLNDLTERMRLDEPLSLPRAKGGLRSGAPYWEEYDNDTRAHVAHVFRREIDAFGWSFGE